MIPVSWMPHHRVEDGELAGYTWVDERGDHTPMNLLGHPLAGPSSLAEARAVLDADGLASLAEPWLLHRAGAGPIRVLVLSAYPDSVVVVEAPYGCYGPDSRQHTLTVPAAELSRAASAGGISRRR